MELKPCPLCGGKAQFEALIISGRDVHNASGFVRCTECFASQDIHRMYEDSVSAWNRRAKEAEHED